MPIGAGSSGSTGSVGPLKFSEKRAQDFNGYHRNVLLCTFQHLDGLLLQAEQVLSDAAASSTFTPYAQDSTPVQHKVVRAYARQVRAAMERLLGEEGIPYPTPRCGTLWAAQTLLLQADIAVDELAPKRLAGYGELSEAGVCKLNRIQLELHGLLGKLSAYLAQGTAGDFQVRLQRLGTTDGYTPLLRELDRVITAHGLVKFRGAFEILLERRETDAFEVAVFGRVSSGKSSLLNHVLEADVLPVGVTPVTALPVRIRYGPNPKIDVEFAEGQARTAELSSLPEYATEERNPGNAKRVTRITVHLPAPRLEEGVTFVDTPGLGSLALAKAARGRKVVALYQGVTNALEAKGRAGSDRAGAERVAKLVRRTATRVARADVRKLAKRIVSRRGRLPGVLRAPGCHGPVGRGLRRGRPADPTGLGGNLRRACGRVRPRGACCARSRGHRQVT